MSINVGNIELGYIHLYRSITRNWIWNNEKYLKRWISILFEVNHADSKINLGTDIYQIKRGQSTKSIRSWSELFECSTKQVITFFDMLEEDDMIKRQTIGKGKHSSTLITVENYTEYQSNPKRKGNAKETQGVSSKSDSDKFLLWFNKKRAETLNKESNIKYLSRTDKSNLKKLKAEYSAKDFNVAYRGMIENKWAKENKQITPTHFLVNNNFNRYFAIGMDAKSAVDVSKLSPEDRIRNIHKQ